MSTSHSEVEVSRVLVGRFQILCHIGSGSFGEVFKGVELATGEPVAIKLELRSRGYSQLANEAQQYRLLSSNNDVDKIPRIIYYGSDGEYNVLVMQLLGDSLDTLFAFCGDRFSLKTTLMLADQMISLVEALHSKDIVHRDIKPDNFLMGTGRKGHHVYIIDFGMAKKYRDPQSHQHIPYKEGKSLTGTARYCSINTHLGIEQSRRDDMEGIGYILIYFLRGSLPWQGLRTKSSEAYVSAIPQRKMEVPVETLCHGLPLEFASYINYVRSLRFEDKPNYNYLRTLFRNVFVRHGYKADAVFDWTIRRMCVNLRHQQQLVRLQRSECGPESMKVQSSHQVISVGDQRELLYKAASNNIL